MPHINTVSLRKAGFSLESCEDGQFWVLEKSPDPEMQRLLAACRYCLTDFEETSFSENFVLQCDADGKEPVLYIDGFLWHLSARDFSSVVRRLGHAIGK